MLASVRSALTYANVMATIAVFIAIGGSSYAAIRVGSREIKDNSVRGKDIRNKTLTGKDVKDHSLTVLDLKLGSLPAGPSGAAGPEGARGPRGLPGAAGSPDTGAQILAKLAPVDGDGSGLDSDSVDGKGPDDFLDDNRVKTGSDIYDDDSAAEIFRYDNIDLLLKSDSDVVADLSVVVQNDRVGSSPTADLHVLRPDSPSPVTVTPNGGSQELTSTSASLSFVVAQNGAGAELVSVTCAWDSANSLFKVVYCTGIGTSGA